MAGQEDAAHVRLAGAGWEVHARSVLGRVRRENQDAWVAVLGDRAGWGPAPGASEQSPDAELDARSGLVGVVGVFDGLGGHAHGRAAARAAACALPRLAAAVPPDGERELIAGLNKEVSATGGFTTAVVVLLRAGRQNGVRLVTSGDSSVYRLAPDGKPGVVRASRLDRAADGRVTDCLGLVEVKGDVRDLDAVDRLLLVTDGVDSFVPPVHLRALLSVPPAEIDAAMNALFVAVHEAGAPDNATALLLARAAATPAGGARASRRR